MNDLSFFITGKCSLDDFRNEYGDKYTDWRLPERRLEAFTRVFDVRMREGELDHWHSGKVIADYMNLTNEQKAWYCLLFGFSYRNHWAMIVLQKFPEIWKESRETIEEWYNDTSTTEGVWRIATFGKDCKWQYRFFPAFIESVQNWLNGESLYEKLGKVASIGTTVENFDNLNKTVCSFKNMGRMTTWLALQTMYEFFDWDIDKHDLQLNNEGCWSQFDSLNYIFNVDFKQTKENVLIHNKNTEILMEYVQNRLPYHVDIYNIESCLCEFRKHWQTNKKQKEFTFWTHGEMVEQFSDLEKKWEGKNIDWDGYMISMMTKGKHANNYGYDPIYFKVGVKTGLNLNTHFYYSDEPDAYELLDIPRPEDCPRSPRYEEYAKYIKENKSDVYLRLKDKYEPTKLLRPK